MNNKEEKEIKEGLKIVIDSLLGKVNQEGFWKYTGLESLDSLVKDIFKNYFSLVEGRSCSSDKAEYATRKLLQSIKEQKTYNLQYTYQDEYEYGIENNEDVSWM